jgi:DNA sulfur modification protein DndD
MIFKSITIEGFLSYYKKTVITFSEVATVILGQNNTGKSKLFDAFNWILFNRIFITNSETWLSGAAEVSNLALNNRLATEAVEGNRERISIVGILSLEGDEGNTFNIERRYHYKLNNGSFNFINEEVIVIETSYYDGSQKPALMGRDAEFLISELIPEKLSRYFLFQGESVSEIMSLHKKSHFTTAITELARLELFEKATKEAENVKNRFKRQISKALEKNEKTRMFRDQAEKQNDELIKRKEKCLEERDDLEAELEELQQEIPKIEDQLSEYEGFKERFKKIESLKSEIQQLKRLENAYSEQSWKNEISETWVFYKIKDDFKKFRDFYKNLSLKGEVPAPISQVVLKEAISTEKCPLCERTLAQGSDEFAVVKKKIINKDLDGLSSAFIDVRSEFDNFESQLEFIPQTISKEQEERARIKRNLEQTSANLKEKRKELDSYSPDRVLEEEKEKIDQLARKLKNKKSLKSTVTIDIAKIDARIAEIDRNISDNDKYLQESVVEGEDQEGQDMYGMALNVFEAMKLLEGKIKDTIYDDIQEKANLYYQEMTKYNKSISGRLVLDKVNSEVYTVDEDNERLNNINQANRISIQLSFIAGILTVAGEQLGVNFPFIADAPISALGGDNKIPAIECLINAFEQSIIILKDDMSSQQEIVTDPVRELIHSSEFIEYAYELSMSKADIMSNQYTVVDCIKGGR